MKYRELDVFLPPAEKPKSRLKTYARRAAVGTAAGAVAAFPNLVADVALPYNQSAAEEMISDAYKEVYGTPFARVHCDTSKYIAELFPGAEGRRPMGRAMPYTDTVWITNERCDACSTLLSRLLSPEALTKLAKALCSKQAPYGP